MPGNAIGRTSGSAGIAGKRGGMRCLLDAVGCSGVAKNTHRSTWRESVAFVNASPLAETDGKPRFGAHFSSIKNEVRQRWLITGTTKDSTGAAIGDCEVELFTTVDDVVRARSVSDSTGAFVFSVDGNAQTRYIVAYKVGSPDIAGTTVNTLVPVLT